MTATLLPLPPVFAKSRILRPLLEKAGEWAEDQLGKFDWATPVSAEWYPISTSYRDEMVGLAIRDGHSTVHGVFRQKELGDELEFVDLVLQMLGRLTGQALDELAKGRLTTASAAGV